MLAKPIAPTELYKRIHAMLARPRPFIISNDYVGPMRDRKKPAVTKHSTRSKFPIRTTTRVRRSRPNPALEDGILA
jgi:DNA-binding response OmpR family regulator